MDLVDGRLLGDTIKQLDFEVLQSEIQIAEQNLQEVAKEKVLFNDLNVGNIMWDDEKQCIKIIDKLPFGQQMKEVIKATDIVSDSKKQLKKMQPQSMADRSKIENMESKMQGQNIVNKNGG